MDWILKAFEELEPEELYAIIRLRNEVFVVEQNCVFQDADNKDQLAKHLCGWVDNQLIAYARLFAPGDYYREAAIGRVVTSPATRRKGYGKLLMQEAISMVYQHYGNVAIRLGAQCYAIPFYASVGFAPDGPEYIEDDIPHIEMVKPAK